MPFAWLGDRWGWRDEAECIDCGGCGRAERGGAYGRCNLSRQERKNRIPALFKRGGDPRALFTIKAGGTRLRQVTHPRRGFVTTEPDWSPKGTWIAYHREKAETEFSKLFKIRPNGSKRKYLSGTCTGNCLSDRVPAWSPNGNRIAFQRELCSVGSNNLQAVYTMWADGSHARRITQKSVTCAGSHRYADLAAQWAPGGKRLAIERLDNVKEKRAILRYVSTAPGSKESRPGKWMPRGPIGRRTADGSLSPHRSNRTPGETSS